MASFDAVDIVVTAEQVVDDAPLPVPFVVHNADEKSLGEVMDELRRIRNKDLDRPEDASGRSILALLPPTIRRLGATLLGRFPWAAARLGPPIGVTSLGMFGIGWGIPVSPITLMVTVGGTINRPAFIGGDLVERVFLPLTLNFDHRVIDGAPAALFASVLRDVMKSQRAFERGT